jgi:tetratricopeptide (TPR) repeat protein
MTWRIVSIMSLKEMMEEIERLRRRGNFRGSENLLRIEQKRAELEGNDPYYHFLGGLLLYYFNFAKDAYLNFNNALLTEDHDGFYVDKYKGIICMDKGKYDRALEYFNKALETARIAGDGDWITAMLNAIGNVYTRLGKYDDALESYSAALKGALDAGNKEWIGTGLCNVGVTHSNMGDYKGSIKYFEDSYALARELDDKRGRRVCLNNLGSAYNNMGQHDEALKLFEEARKYAEEIDDKYGLRIVYNNLGFTYRTTGRLKEALQSYELALTIARQIGDDQGASVAKYWILAIYDDLQKMATQH